jgi:hypothetical protein
VYWTRPDEKAAFTLEVAIGELITTEWVITLHTCIRVCSSFEIVVRGKIDPV